MHKIVLDFETYWGTDYTLRNMTTEQYVRHPEFKAHMVGIQLDDNKPHIAIGEEQIRRVFALIPWHDSVVIMQHGQFDGLILSHHYGIHPAFICDTLSMFRALYPAEMAALSNIAKVLGLTDKGAYGADTGSTKGIRTLPSELARHHGEYCLLDVEITRKAFELMLPRIPIPELRLIDMTIKAFTRPVLHFNTALLQEAYQEERDAMLEMFIKAMPGKAEMARLAIMQDNPLAWQELQAPLSSNPKFAQVLLALGIDPPKKISPAKMKTQSYEQLTGQAPIGLIPAKSIWTYALSKGDEAFKRLLDHEDDTIRALVEARIGAKSRIKETRAKRFIGIAERGAIPIYLKYAGAHTLRWSAGDGTNFQNLPRGSKLRQAIEAPPGYMICVQDLSAIEARVLAWVAGQDDVVDQFRRNEDVYCEMATSIFGRKVTKENKLERQLGKTIVLGAGYGVGPKKFEGMLRIGPLGAPPIILDTTIAEALGILGSESWTEEGITHPQNGLAKFKLQQGAYLAEAQPPNLTKDQFATHCACAFELIKRFREKSDKITRFWGTCNDALIKIVAGEDWAFGHNDIIRTCKEGLILPSGMLLRYVELEAKKEGKRLEFSKLNNRKKGERAKVYGGLVTENIVQRLARDIIAEQMLAIGRKYRVATMTHDEVVCVVPEAQAEECCQEMNRMMCIPPAWCSDLPLGAEGGFSFNYSK